ncbi:HAMP domain-containing histidine kinase [Spirosoma sp. BT702]|uniref:histidine kinase n=1 Tax=Spirosoma profusum TaxID=2771354 RepID=A0A926XUP0_9BACT|nr:HAMP domain-containing sensor histidine kinase [Spirosoma profusum]MBD2700060.1 HAMP domain-containing histidine kinase [Spirosoma profusum]
MSKQRILWIVALMAIGLLGLIGLQVYWISSAIRLQKEQFAYKVTDALQEVVRTLERQEIVFLTKQRIQAREHKSQLMAIAKKEDKIGIKPVRKQRSTTSPSIAQSKTDNPSAGDGLVYRQTIPLNGGALVVQSDALHPTGRPLSLSPEQAAIVAEFLRQQGELMAIGDWQTQLIHQQQFDNWFENVMSTELPRINNEAAQLAHRQDSLRKVRKKQLRLAAQQQRARQANALTAGKLDSSSKLTSSARSKSEEQADRVKDVLKGLLLSDRPIEDRINRLALDTLLRQTLDERGISIPFAYAVRTHKKPEFLFASMGIDAQQVNSSGYKAALFPNNLMETGNYVYVYFPTQQQFILGRLGFTFAASAILILVILACFYIAINTILRQKKLADIKNDFINNMTHEFKTPISTISLAVEMAQEQLRSDVPMDRAIVDNQPKDRLGRYMGIIRDETRRLGSHVEKVLQMALLDRGEIKLNLTSVNVHDVIEKVLNNLSLQIEQRDGELDLHFDADQEVVEADEVHLTNIVYNLLDNALKYSPDSPHITLSTRNVPEGVSITVADQGLGMTKEQTSRIFEKFYRVPTGNRHDVKGFGLGLSYVKKMIDEHHGQILVESQPGKGSSFEVILPYKMSERVKE